MIRIGTLFPKHLNLNGDQGNIKVISQQLKWRGLQVAVIEVTRPEHLEELDFVLIGHGSAAAWSEIESKCMLIVEALSQTRYSTLPLLAISSGYEFANRCGLFGALKPSTSVERISKFEIADFEGYEVLGYLNTTSDLPVIVRRSERLGTMLHGPVLSRSTELLENVLLSIAVHAQVEIAEIQSKEKAGQLADLVSEVWKLERELASE